MRALAEIAADLVTEQRIIDASRSRLAQLMVEEADAMAARRQAAVQAFDDGASRRQICTAFGLTYHQVANYLQESGRTERTRRRARLTASARVHYDKLLQQRVPSRVAAQIAESIGR